MGAFGWAGWLSGLIGRGMTFNYREKPFPMRIPYAERKLATGREILLDYHYAKSISHEFVTGDSPEMQNPQLVQLRILAKRRGKNEKEVI